MNRHIYIIHQNNDTKYLSQLTDQLKQIKGISYWSREDLAFGVTISQQIEEQYQKAKMVIALLSADYFNDEEYCQIYQAKALEDGKIFIPILLRPCLYEEYKAVKERLTLPKNANGDIVALSKLDKTAVEEAWVEIAQLLKKKLNELTTKPDTTTLPPPTIDDNKQSKSANNMNTFSNGYALLIGVGADLRVTIKDAEDLKEILCHPQRSAYPKDHVWCLTDQNATNEGIKKAFDALKEKLEADDVYTDKTVVIYYSGHGGVDDDDGTYFLCPYDYITEGSKTRLLGSTFAQWVDELSDLGAERLLVILDCCHAGGIKDAAIKNSNEQLQKLLGQGQGKITIAACLDTQFSYILPGATNSLFTQVLIEALAGVGLNTTDTSVGVLDITAYVAREVPKVKKEQTPNIQQAQNLTNFPICAYDAGYAKSNPIKTLSGNEPPLPNPPQTNPNGMQNRRFQLRQFQKEQLDLLGHNLDNAAAILNNIEDSDYRYDKIKLEWLRNNLVSITQADPRTIDLVNQLKNFINSLTFG